MFDVERQMAWVKPSAGAAMDLAVVLHDALEDGFDWLPEPADVVMTGSADWCLYRSVWEKLKPVPIDHIQQRAVKIGTGPTTRWVWTNPHERRKKCPW